ncbi:MAG: hypothetical protein ABFC96_10530 [Thermoguttaceae bacterium]
MSLTLTLQWVAIPDAWLRQLDARRSDFAVRSDNLLTRKATRQSGFRLSFPLGPSPPSIVIAGRSFNGRETQAERKGLAGAAANCRSNLQEEVVVIAAAVGHSFDDFEAIQGTWDLGIVFTTT